MATAQVAHLVLPPPHESQPKGKTKRATFPNALINTFIHNPIFENLNKISFTE